MPWIHFDNRYCPVLFLDDLSQFLATVPRITDNVAGMEFAIGVSGVTEDTSSNTDITQTGATDVGSYRKFTVGIGQQEDLALVQSHK